MEDAKPSNAALYTLWLFCVSFSLAGVQFVYSSQFSISGPLFQQKFGISQSAINIILSTAGPISGFLVQPIVGAISDRYTSPRGRRRPFIFWGTICTVIGMIIIGLSVKIGEALGEKFSTVNHYADHYASITFAIFGLWVMNLFNNVTQGPARALVNDLTEEDKKQLANATTAGVMSVAAVAGNLIGASLLHSANPYQIIFLMASGVVFVSMIPTLIAGKEKPYVREMDEEKQSFVGVFKQIFNAFRNIEFSMAKVVFIYFLSWLAYTPLMVNQIDLFNKIVYPGVPNNWGTYMGMYGLALFSTIAFNFSLISPYIIDKIGPKMTYIITQLIATGCYIAIWALPTISPWQALLFTSIPAWNFTAFNSIPFAITSQIVGPKQSGLYMGVLNSASVIAQTLSGAISAPVLSARGDDVRWAIGVGGVFSVLAVIAAFFLETPKRDSLLEQVDYNEE
eukprot:TRINITY_DN3086_c0_g1_i1.p1 TRINITY_DN3086_c0_g1~~TRINITY_DN3086_c0_g1_i1.p1  ORF type:complete len:453 (-),score=76.53 TRINITY_DN3086_c0_g1_i1:70-1428(-)